MGVTLGQVRTGFGQVRAVSELGQVRTGSRRTWSKPVRTCPPELGSGAEPELVQNGGVS